MQTKKILVLAAFAVTCGTAMAQPRRAAIVGSGDSDWGKCSAEIVVDGAAAVEIRGATATLRDVSGQAPQWRRFECTSPMPLNPGDMRIAVTRGRGKVDMVKDPRNGGAAVIRIEDPEGGSDVYAFEVVWNTRGGGQDHGYQPPVDRGPGDRDRGPDHAVAGRFGYPRFNSDEAIHACQDSIRSQAAERFRGRPLEFRRAEADDQPGRNDWVTGTFAVRSYNGSELFKFSCSLDFDSRRVREATFEPLARR